MRQTLDGGPEIGPLTEIESTLDDAVTTFIVVKRRLSLIERFLTEHKRVSEAARARGLERPENDAAWQLVQDCYAMLIIDLASAREGVRESSGLLNAIRRCPERIRRASPEDFGPFRGMGDPEALAEFDRWQRQRIADAVNESIVWLFGPTYPVTPDSVESLLVRFTKATQAIADDRNHVRAHAFEFRPFNRSRYALSLEELKGHIAVFEEFLKRLHHAVTRTSLLFDLEFQGDGAAEDLADVVVFGRINQAALEYGATPKDVTPEDPKPRWYYFRRKEYLEAPPISPEPSG